MNEVVERRWSSVGQGELVGDESATDADRNDDADERSEDSDSALGSETRENGEGATS